MGFYRRLLIALLLIAPQFLRALPPEIYSDDLYLRLGVFPNATYEEIMGEAEKLMSQQRHAIVDFGAKSEGYFKVREAYLTLSDPVKRAAYDLERKVQNRFLGDPPKGWETRVEEFCEDNDPSETYAIAEEPIQVVPIEVGPRLSDAPPDLKPSEFLDEIEDGKVSSAKFGRTAILVRDKSYLNFLADAEASFYLEGRRPRVLDEVFEAHLSRAKAATFPGVLLGVAAVPVGIFGVFVGPGLASLEIGWKIYESKTRTPRALRHLRSFLKDTRQSLIKENDGRRHYTKLANDLVLIDLWLESLFPFLVSKTKDRDFSNPHVHFPILYEERFPLWMLSLRLVEAYPELAPALLFRFLQSRPNALFLEAVMRKNPSFWIAAAGQLQLVFAEQKAQELSQEDKALEELVARLMKVNRGPVMRSTEFVLSAPKRCGQYLAHIAFVAKSLLKRPEGYH